MTISRPPKRYLTCKISNIIYCIICKKGKKQYIGQALRTLGCRMYEHKYDVKSFLTKKSPVSKHFNMKGHASSDMKFSVVEWINQDPETSKDLGSKRENFWIRTFRSLHPFGLNQMM